MNSLVRLSILQPYYYIGTNFNLSIIKFISHERVLAVKSLKANKNDKKREKNQKFLTADNWFFKNICSDCEQQNHYIFEIKWD